MYGINDSTASKKKANQNTPLLELWTDISRKNNISVLFSLQELFLSGVSNSYLRTVMKNSCYLIVYPFPGDILSVRRYFRKIFDENTKLALNCLRHSDSVEKEFSGYLMITTKAHFKNKSIKVRNFVYPLESKESALFNKKSAFCYLLS